MKKKLKKWLRNFWYRNRNKKQDCSKCLPYIDWNQKIKEKQKEILNTMAKASKGKH